MSGWGRRGLWGRAWGTVLAVAFATTGLTVLPATAATATVVSLTFNDAHTSQYTYARPVLQAHGINATFYAASGWVDSGSNSSMAWWQLRDLYRDGNEVGGMGKDHKNLTATYDADPAADRAYKQAQVCDDRQRLVAMGLDPQTFAYPGAGVDATAKTIVADCGYTGARTIGGLVASTSPSAETIPPADPYSIRTANFPTGPVTLQTLQNAVTGAASRGGGWVPMSFNQVCHQGTATYSTCMASAKPVDDAVLSAFLDWLANSGQVDGAPAGTAVRTVRDVMGAPAQPVLPPDPTTVSLTFNDGSVGQYRYARPLLDAAKLRASFYLASNWVDKSFAGTMTWWQVDELYRAGNEIGGMGRDHKDLTATYDPDPVQDQAYKRAQVCDDRDRLAQQGYDPRTFAYTSGAYNAGVQAIVRDCGYAGARAAGGLTTGGPAYAESLPPRDAYGIRTFGGSSAPITLQQLKDAVTAAASHGGGWAPLAFNQVCHQGAADYSTCMSSFRPVDDAVLGEFLTWLSHPGEPGGAPAATVVKTVREALALPQQPPLPVRPLQVSLTFDDGAASQFRTLDLLSARGMAATYYLNTGDMHLSWEQVQTLAAAGNDIGGHTLHHVDLTDPNTTYESKVREVCEDRRALLAHGYSGGSFAYPFADYDSSAVGILKQCGYQSGRRAGGINPAVSTYAETVPAANPYVVRTVYREATGPLGLADLTTAVEAAADHGGGWVPFVFHEVCAPADPRYQECMQSYKAIDTETFDAFLGWLQTQAPPGTSVRTVAQVMGAGKELPRVQVTAPTQDQGSLPAPPQISGTAEPLGGDVTVALYQGQYATGTPIATLTAPNQAGSWSLTPEGALADGTYTVQASQSRDGLVGRSVPTTFTVSAPPAPPADTTAPQVAITAPADGSSHGSSTVTVAGTAGTAAGDASDVTLQVFAGASATAGNLVQTVSVPVGQGSWTTDLTQLADGTYTLRAVQADAAGNTGSSAPVTITVATVPARTVSAVSPGVLGQGATDRLLDVSGAGFAPGDTVSVSGTGVTVRQTAVVSGESLTVSVDVAADAPTGARDLTVTAADGSRAVCGGCLTVQAGPRPTTLTPNQIGQGATRSVTVTGTGFQPGAQAVFSGSGVTARVTNVTSTALTLSVSVAAGTTVGGRDLVVTQPDGGRGTCAGCLTVQPAPTVSSVSPSAIARGASVTVTITGTDFAKGATVEVSGTGVNVGKVTWVGSTRITAVLKATPKAPVGPRSLTVSNPDGGAVTAVDAIRVT